MPAQHDCPAGSETPSWGRKMGGRRTFGLKRARSTKPKHGNAGEKRGSREETRGGGEKRRGARGGKEERAPVENRGGVGGVGGARGRRSGGGGERAPGTPASTRLRFRPRRPRLSNGPSLRTRAASPCGPRPAPSRGHRALPGYSPAGASPGLGPARESPGPAPDVVPAQAPPPPRPARSPLRT